MCRTDSGFREFSIRIDRAEAAKARRERIKKFGHTLVHYLPVIISFCAIAFVLIGLF